MQCILMSSINHQALVCYFGAFLFFSSGTFMNWNKNSQGLLSASEKLLPGKIKLFAISSGRISLYLVGPLSSFIFLFSTFSSSAICV